jgi:class 3 adenylate cyclase
VEDVPKTSYARADDGVHIAYQVFGSGPFDLVLVPGFISHVEVAWETPGLPGFLRRLGSFARVISFDKRGTGMSDRPERLPDVDRRMLDIEAVMAAAGSDSAAIVAASEGGPMAILFAAAHPERTRALALWGTYARITQSDDYPIGIPRDQLTTAAEFLEPAWGSGVGLGGWAPSVAADPEARAAFGRLQRLAASPGAAMALMTSYLDIDVRAALPLVHAPTLVLHHTDDRMVPVTLGRYLAEHIAGARLAEFAGSDHFWWTQNADAIVDEIEEFLTGTRPAPEPDRVLRTVLFTDIVESTESAARLGDGTWRRLLDRHDAMAARHIAQHGGSLIKTTGDGVLATFDGPARAVRAATAIRDSAHALGLSTRAGAHIGEIELRGADVSGLAVNLAQRVCGVAGSDEVLVSRTLVDLVVGSGLEFDDRGDHQLKGIPGDWRLYAVRPR